MSRVCGERKVGIAFSRRRAEVVGSSGWLGCAIFLTCCVILPGRAAGQCYYTWVRIPNPAPGTHCVGTCINDSGTVGGYIVTGGDSTIAFVWSPKVGRVHLPFPPGYISMDVAGINDLGHVTGSMWGPAGWAGFLWDGENHTIIQLPPWANMIRVAGINNNDQVVGTVLNNSVGPLRPFVWQNGVLTDLGDITDSLSADGLSINERGATVGAARDAAFNRHAWMIDASQVISWLPEPAGYEEALAYSLNNNGLITGISWVADSSSVGGVVWAPWETYVIPAAPQAEDARVSDVNDYGRAVGSYDGGTFDRPFVWQYGLLSELRSLVVPDLPYLRYAHAINRLGQIVAEENQGSLVLNPIWLTADLTGDCHVSIDDLSILLSSFGSPFGSFPAGDVDGDGQVNLADLALLLSQWGE